MARGCHKRFFLVLIQTSTSSRYDGEKGKERQSCDRGPHTSQFSAEARKSCSLGAPGLKESTLGSSAAWLASARSYGGQLASQVLVDNSVVQFVCKPATPEEVRAIYRI
jgi:hypothetical protein